jgi:hypothetical protein
MILCNPNTDENGDRVDHGGEDFDALFGSDNGWCEVREPQDFR